MDLICLHIAWPAMTATAAKTAATMKTRRETNNKKNHKQFKWIMCLHSNWGVGSGPQLLVDCSTAAVWELSGGSGNGCVAN